jgi:hypothetical protein
MLRNVVQSLVLCALPLSVGHAQPQSELVELFNGTLDNWRVVFTEAGNISVADGVLRVAGGNGWLRSSGRYQDFRLEVEFRFVTDDADSGVFLRADADRTFARGWPDRSYQVQLRNPMGESAFPPVGFLFRHRMPEGAMRFDEAAARQAALPTGEWQTLAIELAGERLAVWLNGTLVMRAVEITPSRNFIGLQAETGVLEFRSIRIDER